MKDLRTLHAEHAKQIEEACLLDIAAALAATASLPLDPPKPPPSVDGWFDPFKTVDMLAAGWGEA